MPEVQAPVGPLVLLVDWNFDYYHVTRPNATYVSFGGIQLVSQTPLDVKPATRYDR